MKKQWVLAMACLTGGMLSPSMARANEPITCANAIQAANDADQDWTAGKADGLHAIDGGKIGNIEELGKALIGAKRDIPFVIGGNFSGWDFSASQVAFSGVCFYESDLSGTKWDNADLFGIGFIKANLSAASFANAKLEHVLLRDLNLNGTRMQAAKLNNGDLDGGWDGDLTDWDLTGADLTGFTFGCGITVDDGCALTRDGVKFSGAILKDADISTLPFWGQADYYGAILDGTILSPRQLTDIKGANISGSNVLRGGDIKVSLSIDELAELVNRAIEGASTAERPSFDCAKASDAAEKFICDVGGSALRRQDRQLGELYSYVRPKNPAIVPSQKAWLAARAKCADMDCLEEKYRQRIDALTIALGEVEMLAPGKEALFIDWEVPFPNSFLDKPLFAKVTPVLVDSSTTELLLTRHKNGSYAVSGSAVGGNAHMCSLEADRLRFDKKSGWFGAGEGKDFAAVLRFAGDEIEVVGDGHPGEDHPGSAEYVSCGARALFGPVKRIKVDAATMERTKAALSINYGE